MNQGPMQARPDIYESVIESLKDYAVFTTDKDAIITSWSKGAERILLYKAPEIVGRSGNVLYTPEDIAANVPEREIGTAMADGKAVNERFHVKKDRSRFWGSGLVYPLYNKEHEHIGFTKIMQNASDEDQARANLREERLMAETLIATNDEPIVILNADMIVIDATPSFSQSFGLDKISITGKNFYEIAGSGIDMDNFRTTLEPLMKANNFHATFDLTYEHPQKGNRDIRVKP